MSSYIYADNAATTPLSPAALEAMMPYLTENFGNPSSLHGIGGAAKKAVESARSAIAEIANCEPDEVIFTSGGSESDNAALYICRKFGAERGRNALAISAVEHHAVSRPAEEMAADGFDVLKISPDPDGMVTPDEVIRTIAPIRDRLCGASIMLANNETGCIFDIRRISEAVKETGALFHTDAVQAVGHIAVDFKKIGADMMSFSAHKFHGPKGVGALICRRGVPVSPFILGGAQESSRRAGTENVAGIVGMAAALRESVQTLEADAKYVAGLRDELLSGLAEISGFSSNAECSLPGILSVRFAGADGEAIVRSLDLFGIAASAGAACNSTEVKASPVLLAMGLSEKDAASAVRFSLDRTNTMDDVRAIVSAMKRILSFA